MLLACNYSDQLMELLNKSIINIDYIKLGIMPMYEGVYENALSMRSIMLHGLGFNEDSSMKDNDRIDWNYANQLIAKFKSPHVGFHLVASANDWTGYSEEQIIEHFIKIISLWKHNIKVPFLIENMPYSSYTKEHFAAMEFCSDPKVINLICKEANVDLILDIAHAKIAAVSFGYTVQEYIDMLPIQRVKEIHVVGTEKNSEEELIDAHVEMNSEDYNILQWVLSKTSPRIVTLEYGGPSQHFLGGTDKDALVRQITKITDICKNIE